VSEKYDTLTLMSCQAMFWLVNKLSDKKRTKSQVAILATWLECNYFESLVRKRLSTLFATCNNRAPFEAEPVNGANAKEHNQ